MSSKPLLERVTVSDRVVALDTRSRSWGLGVSYEDTVRGVTDGVTPP